MALQNNRGIQNFLRDDELIVLGEKIYLLPGAKPKANGKHSLPVIGSKSNGDVGKQNLFSPSLYVREIQDKEPGSSQVKITSRMQAKSPTELISVDNVSLITNAQGKKLVYRSESTPWSQEVSSLASPSSKKLNSVKMSSAFLWPPIQERSDFIENPVDTEISTEFNEHEECQERQ